MNPTLKALLSRNIPYVLANNLVLAGMTMGKLAKLDDNKFKKLGLEDVHIAAIRENRPSIPMATLERLFEDSWRVCCVCNKRELGIVVHHIKEWSDGGTHDESNLAVLCLIDHDRAHLKGGHSKMALSEAEIRLAKQKWIKRAKKIRASYDGNLLSPYHREARWFWVHLDRLRAMQPHVYIEPMDSHTKFLLDNGFINETGHITAESEWTEVLEKPQKDYAFDSSNGQKMAMYVADVLVRVIQTSGVLDITDMLREKACLQSYIRNGMLVFFRSQIDISRNPDGYPGDDQWLQGTVGGNDVKLSFIFERRMATSMTARGTHLLTEAERSIFGEVTSISAVGSQIRVTVTPLGISPDFLLHDPSHGAWIKGADNSDFTRRRKRAKAY